MPRWKQLGRALLPGLSVWLGGGGLALAGVIIWNGAPTRPDAVRYAGLGLEWGGLIIIAVGLHDMRRRFEEPSLVTTFRQWLRQLAASFRKPQAITMSASIGRSSAMGHSAELTVSPAPGASADERFRKIEADLDRLRRDTDERFSAMSRRIHQTDKRAKVEHRERQSADENLRRLLKEVAVGGLHLEVVGLVWLALGVLCTTIPEEISRLF
jgi:hypothetical protein